MYFLSYLVFSFFQWQEFHTHFDMSEILTLSLLSVWFFTFLIFFLYTYNVQKPNTFSSKMTVNFLSIIAYFNVPYTGLHVNVLLKSYDQPFFIFFKVIAAISLVIGSVLTLMFLKLKIKPLRKGNAYWSVTNQYEFNRFILNFLRTLIFTIDGVYAVTLVVSTALEYLLRFSNTKYYQKAYLSHIETSSNLVIGTHLGFILYSISSYNDVLAQKFLLVCWLIFFFKGFYDFHHQ